MSSLSHYRYCHLALDLEGTLISNAVSQIPRPGLHRFLDLCDLMFDDVVMFTTVPEDRFRAIAAQLVQDGQAPHWFISRRHLHCADGQKDLRRVPRFGPKTMTLLVDDYAGYVVAGQEPLWLPIDQFGAPYPDDDAVLESLAPVLARRVLAWRWMDNSTADLVDVADNAGLSLPNAWEPGSLASDQATDLLALLACASGLTASRESAFALITHPWTDLGGHTFLDLVRSGRSATAIGYCLTLTAGALG